MTAEILIAIAILCSNTARPIGFEFSETTQLKCQKAYINCVKVKTEKEDQLGKALANCVKEK